MERWQNRVAVVTGASSGIGAAVLLDLVKAGLIVVGLARRHEKIIELRNSLPPDQQKRTHAIKCDVSKEQDVKDAFDYIDKNLGGTDILVNNAGIYREGYCLITPGNSAAMRDTMETNVMGVIYCTREAFGSMKKRNFDGHIVIVNSILGHTVWNFLNPDLISPNMYAPTKFAVTAMAETYRQEFINAGTKVKITSISPGLVKTDMVPEALYTRKEILNPKDVAGAIHYAIATPPHVQVHEITIKPVGELF